MEHYAIRRRDAWRSATDFEEAAARVLKIAGRDQPEAARWIRSYVLDEGGTLGTLCVYEATGPEAIRTHASAADIPLDEIIPIVDTFIVRSDPGPATLAAKRTKNR